jgi:DNA mismatch endonuclease (patch repair protein)
MEDRITPEQRSRNMARVRGRNTTPELAVRSLLHRMRFRFRVCVRNLPGSPDIVLPKYRTVIFVHGCFWHGHEGCMRASVPASNRFFWERKFARTVERDQIAREQLIALGWRVLTVWECDLRKDLNAAVLKMSRTLDSCKNRYADGLPSNRKALKTAEDRLHFECARREQPVTSRVRGRGRRCRG